MGVVTTKHSLRSTALNKPVAYVPLDAEKDAIKFAQRELKAKKTPKGWMVVDPRSYGYLFNSLVQMVEKFGDKVVIEEGGRIGETAMKYIIATNLTAVKDWMTLYMNIRQVWKREGFSEFTPEELEQRQAGHL